MATLRNIAISQLHLAGITRTLQRTACDRTRAFLCSPRFETKITNDFADP
jgi:hypothetical protein